MKRISKISKISRVVGDKSKLDPTSTNIGTDSGNGGGPPAPGKQPPVPPTPKPEDTMKPGTITLSPEEVLEDSFLDRIKESIKDGGDNDWDVGKVEGEGSEGNREDITKDNPEDQLDDEPEDRDWGGNTPSTSDVSQQIDQAIKEAQQKAAERERKSNSEKTKGGNGQGGFRDRITMAGIANTDWAKIFESKLTEYSREQSKHLPYTRRLSGGPLGRTLPSKTLTKDTLPETNIVIDTSSSLSYVELETILVELQHALISAKITIVNIILWTSTPYWYKTYKDVDKLSFNKIINDIQDNWQGGGNDIDKVYELMIDKGWTKKFTLHFTDGWIKDHREGRTSKLSYLVHDPQNTIFGIIYPSQRISYEDYMKTADKFPGEKVPIFLDTSKFGK